MSKMPKKIWAARFGDLDHGDWVGATAIDPQLEGGVLYTRADTARARLSPSALRALQEILETQDIKKARALLAKIEEAQK